MKLQNYLQDGANHQAQSVISFLKGNCNQNINVARWENYREQGYILSLYHEKRQLNIIVFEHRNSDSICAVKWEQLEMNSITIETAKFGEVYKTKYDISFEVSYGQILLMVEWINEEFDKFIKETTQ